MTEEVKVEVEEIQPKQILTRDEKGRFISGNSKEFMSKHKRLSVIKDIVENGLERKEK